MRSGETMRYLFLLMSSSGLSSWVKSTPGGDEMEYDGIKIVFLVAPPLWVLITALLQWYPQRL